MKAMLLIAHGSRKQAANEEVCRLADQIRGLASNDFDEVMAVFLEFAEPDIQQGVERCVELGAGTIIAVPYFLAAGNHVSSDIPGELACAGAGHPQVNIEVAQYLGESEAMAELVLSCSRLAG